MDNSTPPALPERNPVGPSLNGGGSHARRPSPGPGPPASPGGVVLRPTSLMDTPPPSAGGAISYPLVQVVVNKDDRGYGMKVTGDNPVYVQSVKEGGPAEKAGLHAGDKIIKVNGTNVRSSTHIEVVNLIRAQTQVILTVQQRTFARLSQGSPSMHNRQSITNPQPVDNEKQSQLQRERENYYRLMIEKEKNYVDTLRSKIAVSPDEKKLAELAKTEKNIETLEACLYKSLNEQSISSPSPSHSPIKYGNIPTTSNGNSGEPPPLPKRNLNMKKTKKDHHFNTIPSVSQVRSSQRATSTPTSPIDLNIMFAQNEINANRTPTSGRRSMLHSRSSEPPREQPPPLPPRSTNPSSPQDPDAVNSINKQMSYPLVACTSVLNQHSPNGPTHHRTKSSPESLSNLSGDTASGRLTASESMNDLSRQDGGNWERAPDTPPGTPPPPYPSPQALRKDRSHDDGFILAENQLDGSPEIHGIFRTPSNSKYFSDKPRAAISKHAQPPIISMEDDEISDLELNQVEDHGHFKTLALLWEHLPHLAVFMNYVLSNSDPNSLLFYLLTDLYKEGNAKEMRKWAFEIHSCFLVPGAPLRLSNVDENIAREIDDVLTREFDKEEILRKIFWKARSRAKEELQRQLVDFQQKRTAGLGTIFGPADQELSEIYHDKSKEVKLYERLFLKKLDPYLEEIEKDTFDPRRYYTAAALATVLTRIFQIRPTSHNFEKFPTFVNKEKSFRLQFLGKYSKKWNIHNHQFCAQQYFTVIACYHCHQIIYGIGPQGYQCSACHIHLHRTCVKLYDDTCPGPVNKNNKFKFIRMRQESNDNRRKQNSIFLQNERDVRQVEENDSSFELLEGDSNKTGQPVSRSGSDRRPDAVREERHQLEGAAGSGDPMNDSLIAGKDDWVMPDSGERVLPKKKSTNVNRSESVKEQSEKRKQRRNISDPSHNTTGGEIDLDTPTHPGHSNPDSNSSSTSSLSNGRLSESPSTSVDAVQTGHNKTDADSDTGFESDIPMWHNLISEKDRKCLNPQEQKRQEIINEIFSTEHSHVRGLRVLHKIFYDKLRSSQILKTEELHMIFPNIKELHDVHYEYNKKMKECREETKPLVKEVGDLLLRMFDGPEGERLKTSAAKFCEKQHHALEFITEKRKKDTKFDNLLADCEKKRHCRRLPLQGILPSEMQRLLKYPMLLERLINNTDASCVDELSNLKKAHQLSKSVANFVDEAVKLASNRHRLEEIQKHLEVSSLKSDHPLLKDVSLAAMQDLTRHKLIREGSMSLRRPNKPLVPVHVLLMEDVVYILQRDADRYVLKFYQSGSSSSMLPLSPYLKTSQLLVRLNAVCKNGLYLVNTNTNSSQIYDLITEEDAQRDMWFRHFSEAVETYNKKDGKLKQPPVADLGDGGESVQELPQGDARAERAEKVVAEGAAPDLDDCEESDAEDAEKKKDDSPEKEHDAEEGRCKSPETVSGGGGVQRIPKVTAEEWPLIQPSQVQVEVPPVHTAESMLTPLEQIRRKDIEVRRALEAKEHLVADLLNIPREDFAHIADMASADATGHREPTERVMAAIYQTNLLQQLVNESLNVTEADAVIARAGKTLAACASQQGADALISSAGIKPAVDASAVQTIAYTLTRQLHALLADVKQMEDERDRLRKDNVKLRECLHEQSNLHGPVEDATTEEKPSETNGNDLGNSEESQKPEECEAVGK